MNGLMTTPRRLNDGFIRFWCRYLSVVCPGARHINHNFSCQLNWRTRNYFLYKVILTYWSLKISLSCVIWTCHTSENNFWIKHKLNKCLKKSCSLGHYQQFSLEYFQLSALVNKISPMIMTIMMIMMKMIMKIIIMIVIMIIIIITIIIIIMIMIMVMIKMNNKDNDNKNHHNNINHNNNINNDNDNNNNNNNYNNSNNNNNDSNNR